MTVDAVLAAAAESFVRDGFEGASVNRIAARAGVSIGSLYQYYPSKEALVVALIERHTRESLELLEQVLLDLSDAPLGVSGEPVKNNPSNGHQKAARAAF